VSSPLDYPPPLAVRHHAVSDLSAARSSLDESSRHPKGEHMTRYLIAALAGLAVAGTAAAHTPFRAHARAGAIVLKANLTGSYLHTTSTGTGTATITIKPGQVCWKFTYRGLDKPGDSGVHIAPPPAAGKHKTSVFPFTATTSTAPGCLPADHWGGGSSAAWAQKIAADPTRFYVIVGTVKYPQGAIGGVLHRS
jgi:hypothetical protein